MRKKVGGPVRAGASRGPTPALTHTYLVLEWVQRRAQALQSRGPAFRGVPPSVPTSRHPRAMRDPPHAGCASAGPGRPERSTEVQESELAFGPSSSLRNRHGPRADREQQRTRTTEVQLTSQNSPAKGSPELQQAGMGSGVVGGPRAQRARWALRAVLALALAALVHYAALGFRAAHLTSAPPPVPPDDDTISADAGGTDPDSEGGDPTGFADFAGLGLSAGTRAVLAALPRGPYVRDAYPVRTMEALLELAEAEIRAAGVETCGDRLGVPLLEAWATTGRDVCGSEGARELRLRSSDSSSAPCPGEDASEPDSDTEGPLRRSVLHYPPSPNPGPRGEAAITCFDAKDARGSSWWPAGAYPCLSSGLESGGNLSHWTAARECQLPRTRDRAALANTLSVGEPTCEHWEDVTTVLVPRRDAWNP